MKFSDTSKAAAMLLHSQGAKLSVTSNMAVDHHEDIKCALLQSHQSRLQLL